MQHKDPNVFQLTLSISGTFGSLDCRRLEGFQFWLGRLLVVESLHKQLLHYAI